MCMHTHTYVWPLLRARMHCVCVCQSVCVCAQRSAWPAVCLQDEWACVSQPCLDWLSGRHQALPWQQATHPHSPPATPPAVPGGGGGHDGAPLAQGPASSGAGELGRPALPAALLERLVEGLLPAVKAGEAQGTLHARKLSTALLHAGVCMHVFKCAASCVHDERQSDGVLRGVRPRCVLAYGTQSGPSAVKLAHCMYLHVPCPGSSPASSAKRAPTASSACRAYVYTCHERGSSIP